jgi:DNA primase
LVDEIRARTDIAELIGRSVTLKRTGRTYTGLCPFHNERTPSFNVIPDKGIFHCFGCGAGGDAIAFIQKSTGASFIEALKELAQACGVSIEERPISPQEAERQSVKADLYDALELAARWFEETLLVRPEGAPGRRYLQDRGVTLETARNYRVGYAPEGWDKLAIHLQKQRLPMELALKAGLVKKSERTGGWYDVFRGRLIFAIPDEKGRPVAFGGRILPGLDAAQNGVPVPKYLNSPESEVYEKSKVLYGLHWARPAIQRTDRIILVEGYFDAIALWQGGIFEAVATCGTALTPHQLERIRRLTRKAIALFDSDEAGIRAAMKSMEHFLDAGVEAWRLTLQGAKDPDEFIQKFGKDAFEEALRKSEPLIKMMIWETLRREGPAPEARVRALESLTPLLRKLPPLIRDEQLGLLAGHLNMRPEDLEQHIGHAPTSTPSPTHPPTRWQPNKELTHLLWLVIHFPHLISSQILAADPTWITDQEEVLAMLGRLCEGAALPDVLGSISDSDVSRVILKIAAQPDLYEESQAVSASKQILARMELLHIDAKIRALNAALATNSNVSDTSSQTHLAIQVASLYARQAALRSLASRRA